MSNSIQLKDISGNNIYPEIDTSTLSGTITENASGFVIGGDVYTALDNVSANAKDVLYVKILAGPGAGNLDTDYATISEAINNGKIVVVQDYDSNLYYYSTRYAGSNIYFTTTYTKAAANTLTVNEIYIKNTQEAHPTIYRDLGKTYNFNDYSTTTQLETVSGEITALIPTNYVTSGDYISGNSQYALTSGGWTEITGGGSNLPISSADNSILAGSSDGTMSWQILGKSYYGGTVTDDTGDFVTDDNNESIIDDNGIELFDSFNDIGFAAQRAFADSEGNNIISTYATKSEITRLQPLFYDAGSLTDSSAVNVYNNAIQELSSSQSALTLNVNCSAGEVPNFAIEISASTAITLTVTKTVNNTVTTLYPSENGGTSLESGKYYQVTCVGNCWTLGVFTVPNA